MHLRLFREQPASQPFPCPFINTPLPHPAPHPTDRRYRQRKPQHQSKCTAPSGGAIEPGPFQISPLRDRQSRCVIIVAKTTQRRTQASLRLPQKLWPHYNNSNNSSDAFPSSARMDLTHDRRALLSVRAGTGAPVPSGAPVATHPVPLGWVENFHDFSTNWTDQRMQIVFAVNLGADLRGAKFM